MPHFSSFLLQKYLSARRAPRSLRIILRLCYLGIGIGAFALMSTLIITRGFEKEIGKKMKGISSDIVITSASPLPFAPLEKHLKKHLSRHIQGISPSITRHVLLENKRTQHVLYLRGISPRREAATTTLEKKILYPHHKTLHALLRKKGSLIIGKQLAIRHRIQLGDEITILSPEPTQQTRLYLNRHTARVAGIFSLGLEEYDAHAAYCSLATMRGFFEDAVNIDHIALSLKKSPTPPQNLSWWQRLLYRVRMAFTSPATYFARQVRAVKVLLSGLSVRSWQELYPDLFASLALEKYAMTIVLMLIALVASMLMISLLFMFIQYKQRDIAILRAMGASEKDIYRLFSRIGFRITLTSVTTGLALSGLIGWWIQTYKPIRLPDVYYVSHLPAALETSNFIVIFLITLALSWLACKIPLRQLKSFSVSKALRE